MRGSYVKRNLPIKIHFHHCRLRIMRRMFALQMESHTRSLKMRQLVRTRPEVLRGVIGNYRQDQHRPHRFRHQQMVLFTRFHNIYALFKTMATFHEIRQFNHRWTSSETMVPIISCATKLDRHCSQCRPVDRLRLRSVLS